MSDNMARDALLGDARRASDDAYAPYSGLRIGAALAFADGTVITGSNVENASYGLSLCAETMAAAKAMNEGHRGGLEAVAVFAARPEGVTPCGRCRQVLNELATLGGTDPVVWCSGDDGEVIEARLSSLLPYAFGPASL